MLYIVTYRNGLSIEVSATDLDECYSIAFDETGISSDQISHVEPCFCE